MKKLLLNLIIILAGSLVPMITFAQQESGWTPEQQEQFRAQMNDFKLQMETQMEQLRDSLEEMQERLKEEDWSGLDSSWNFNLTLPELPEAPEPPTIIYYDSEGTPHYGDQTLLEVNPGDDSTEVRLGKWKLTVEDNGDGDEKVRIYKDESCCEEDYDEDMKNLRTKFLLIDIGLNNYFANGLSSNFPAGYQSLEPIPGKSWVVDLHVFSQQLNLVQHRLWLTYGVFFEFNSYKYSSDNVMIPRADSVGFVASEMELKKNKLAPTYIGIPLMLRFETNPRDVNNSFHISMGGFGEYLLGAHTKVKTIENDKIKQHDDFNLNRFRYGITGRVGYAWINLFVNYGLSELFEEGTGPELTPVSAGLAFEF